MLFLFCSAKHFRGCSLQVDLTKTALLTFAGGDEATRWKIVNLRLKRIEFSDLDMFLCWFFLFVFCEMVKYLFGEVNKFIKMEKAKSETREAGSNGWWLWIWFLTFKITIKKPFFPLFSYSSSSSYFWFVLVWFIPKIIQNPKPNVIIPQSNYTLDSNIHMPSSVLHTFRSWTIRCAATFRSNEIWRVSYNTDIYQMQVSEWNQYAKVDRFTFFCWFFCFVFIVVDYRNANSNEWNPIESQYEGEGSSYILIREKFAA